MDSINIFALLGFIAAILGLVLIFFTGFPYFLGSVGLAFGIVGWVQIRRGKGGGKFFCNCCDYSFYYNNHFGLDDDLAYRGFFGGSFVKNSVSLLSS